MLSVGTQVDGFFTFNIVSDIEGTCRFGVKRLAVDSQGVVPGPNNRVAAVGVDGHRLAVAEDEGHVAVEGEGVVVGEVAVRYIPARIECCFVAREHGKVCANVHLAFPVHIVDEMGPQGLATNGIDLVLVERAADDDILVLFAIEGLPALDGDGPTSTVATSKDIVVGIGPAEGDVVFGVNAGSLHLATVDGQVKGIDATITAVSMDAAAVDGHRSTGIDAIIAAVSIDAAAVDGHSSNDAIPTAADMDAATVHNDVAGLEGISPRIANNNIAAVLGVGSCEEIDGRIFYIITKDIEGAGHDGVEALAIEGQAGLEPINVAAIDRHRLAVAEDEGHVAVEGEGAVVGEVVVHRIPARLERCFIAREDGEVVACVYHAVPVNVID